MRIPWLCQCTSHSYGYLKQTLKIYLIQWDLRIWCQCVENNYSVKLLYPILLICNKILYNMNEWNHICWSSHKTSKNVNSLIIFFSLDWHFLNLFFLRHCLQFLLRFFEAQDFVTDQSKFMFIKFSLFFFIWLVHCFGQIKLFDVLKNLFLFQNSHIFIMFFLQN